MSLNADAVRKIGWLARLAIDEDKVEAYAKDLSGILDFVAQMDTVDTADTLPMAHPLEQMQRLRADAVTEIDQRALFQANAPSVEAGLFLVPKVIE
ncbi:MAG: Asp-tRNA(Asn)/Glu-tRNA(Gln) amidotransferase subunit GatC [Methylotetracoccus sp.]